METRLRPRYLHLDHHDGHRWIDAIPVQRDDFNYDHSWSSIYSDPFTFLLRG